MITTLDSQWENFKLFGLIYYAYPKKFELFWAWLLKKRATVGQSRGLDAKDAIESLGLRLLILFLLLQMALPLL